MIVSNGVKTMYAAEVFLVSFRLSHAKTLDCNEAISCYKDRMISPIRFWQRTIELACHDMPHRCMLWSIQV